MKLLFNQAALSRRLFVQRVASYNSNTIPRIRKFASPTSATTTTTTTRSFHTSLSEAMAYPVPEIPDIVEDLDARNFGYRVISPCASVAYPTTTIAAAPETYDDEEYFMEEDITTSNTTAHQYDSNNKSISMSRSSSPATAASYIGTSLSTFSSSSEAVDHHNTMMTGSVVANTEDVLFESPQIAAIITAQREWDALIADEQQTQAFLSTTTEEEEELEEELSDFEEILKAEDVDSAVMDDASLDY